MTDKNNVQLAGAGLVLIRLPELVARYNRCLEKLGIEPTGLSEFHVDGIGWSPEIAAEKNNDFYLSHGIANQLAIIINPDQENKPIDFPYNSYVRHLIDQYFSSYRPQITDITTTHCLWLEFDQELTRYEKPEDLLLVDRIIVRSHAGKLLVATRGQKKLIERAMNRDKALLDNELRRRIIEIFSEFGDLRNREVEIPDMAYNDLPCFYSRAFGGMYVFRGLAGRKRIVVMEDDEEYKTYNKDEDVFYKVGEKRLLSRLLEEGLLEVNLEWYRGHIKVLKEKLEYFVINKICGLEPDIDYLGLTPAQVKRIIIDIGNEMPDLFFELERLIKHIETGEELLSGDQLSRELQLILMRPAHTLPVNMREVIWHLICRINPFDIFRLYIADKEGFFRHYNTWPKSKQDWVTEKVKSCYLPRMNR